MIKKACLVGNSVKNTGKECNISMGPSAMLIAVPASLRFVLSDIQDDILAWITPLLHGALGARVYPLFGQTAPINTINNSAEGDVTVTLDDGTVVFVRYGIYNRIYETVSGGLCYAKELMSFLNSGMSIIEVDKQGQMLICKAGTKDEDGEDEYRGLIPNQMYAPSPILADLKNPYKNRFSYSFDPTEMVNNGEIFNGASPLLAIMGLIDTVITQGAAASITKLKIGVQTECAEADLVALIGADLADPTNFKVTRVSTGVDVVPSAAAIAGGLIELTGTYVSGAAYSVKGTAPSVWLGNDIDGYDASDGAVIITIP